MRANDSEEKDCKKFTVADFFSSKKKTRQNDKMQPVRISARARTFSTFTFPNRPDKLSLCMKLCSLHCIFSFDF